MDYGFNGEDLYVCLEMEYANGGDLEGFIKMHKEKDERIPQRMVVSLLYQIWSALYYLERKKLLHRDLKPPNILLRKPHKDRDDVIIKIGV